MDGMCQTIVCVARFGAQRCVRDHRIVGPERPTRGLESRWHVSDRRACCQICLSRQWKVGGVSSASPVGQNVKVVDDVIEIDRMCPDRRVGEDYQTNRFTVLGSIIIIWFDK